MKPVSAAHALVPFITFENATLRIRDRHILPSTNWEIKQGENWVILGSNGSGKSTLMRALTGETPVVGGRIHRHHPLARPESIGYVSFEIHRKLIAMEQAADAARYFSGEIEDYLQAGGILNDADRKDKGKFEKIFRRVFSNLGIQELLKRPVRFLSTGEIRRILIARAMLRSRGLLLLDEPFEGLDREGHRYLTVSINLLIESGMQVMLATHRRENISPTFSHVIGLKNGRVFCQGTCGQVLRGSILNALYDGGARVSEKTADIQKKHTVFTGEKRPVVIDMRGISVRYQDRCIFENLNWVVRKGENWSISGPNGSGKTTLLQMITADNLQAYANDIRLFGKRRGSGESIWEIKQRLGVVSSEFQINYRKPIRSFDVVLSGFFDSVGLYRQADKRQSDAAREWIDRLKLGHLIEKRYDLLSYGERRMILLARAVVKTPEMLVLDEPCQGLDPANRQLILEMIDLIGSRTNTQILYVSHHPEEMPVCITHHLNLSE